MSLKDKSPEQLLDIALDAIGNNQNQRATAIATAGLLSMAIGAAKAARGLKPATQHGTEVVQL